MLKFDIVVVFKERIIVCYFEKNLKFFIKAKINKNVYQLNNIKDLVTKVVKIEAKVSL